MTPPADRTAAGPRPRVLAHRGARAVAPENTLEAFRLARAMGAAGIELDVRRTRDGAVVVHHDAAPAGEPPIVDRDLAELRDAHPGLPTLAEALDVCGGLLVNVEIKNHEGEPDFAPEAADPVLAVLGARGGRDRVLVSSFDLATIDRVRATAPDVPTGYLFTATTDPERVVGLAADRGHRALHPNLWALRGRWGAALVARAHERGLEVNVWTVNRPRDVVRLARLGVDAVITDVPDVALAALGQAGTTSAKASRR